MPLVDMPLQELEKYTGDSLKPEDFDAFWEEGLKEISACDPCTDIILSDFQLPIATFYHMHFKSIGGATIHAKLVVPKNSVGKAPAILKFHGYLGASDDWSELIPYAAIGMVAVAMDCRGQGGHSEDLGDVKGATSYGYVIKGVSTGKESLYYRHVFLDTVQLVKVVKALPSVDPLDINVTGISQGAALALVCSALVPEIKKAFAVYPFLSDYRRVLAMDLGKEAYDGLIQHFRRFDPLHASEFVFFETLAYIDVQHFAARIQADVLFLTGLMDTVCPPSTQFAVYNKIRSLKRMHIFPDFAHEKLPGKLDFELQFLTDK